MKMREIFGILPDGKTASLYTITSGDITAVVTDLGATLVKLFVPGRDGKRADVVLGFDSMEKYLTCPGFLGAVVGRNCNRIGGAAFTLNGKRVQLQPNDKGKNKIGRAHV